MINGDSPQRAIAKGYVSVLLSQIPTDLSTDDLCPGLGDWIIPTPYAIDEMVPPIQPQPDLENTVVVPHPRWLLQHPSPLHGIRA